MAISSPRARNLRTGPGTASRPSPPPRSTLREGSGNHSTRSCGATSSDPSSPRAAASTRRASYRAAAGTRSAAAAQKARVSGRCSVVAAGKAAAEAEAEAEEAAGCGPARPFLARGLSLRGSLRRGLGASEAGLQGMPRERLRGGRTETAGLAGERRGRRAAAAAAAASPDLRNFSHRACSSGQSSCFHLHERPVHKHAREPTVTTARASARTRPPLWQRPCWYRLQSPARATRGETRGLGACAAGWWEVRARARCRRGGGCAAGAGGARSPASRKCLCTGGQVLGSVSEVSLPAGRFASSASVGGGGRSGLLRGGGGRRGEGGASVVGRGAAGAGGREEAGAGEAGGGRGGGRGGAAAANLPGLLAGISGLGAGLAASRRAVSLRWTVAASQPFSSARPARRQSLPSSSHVNQSVHSSCCAPLVTRISAENQPSASTEVTVAVIQRAMRSPSRSTSTSIRSPSRGHTQSDGGGTASRALDAAAGGLSARGCDGSGGWLKSPISTRARGTLRGASEGAAGSGALGRFFRLMPHRDDLGTLLKT